MSVHTPGPWFFDPEPFDDDDVEITAASRRGYTEIAKVASAGEEEDPAYPLLAEQRANARLIAAAPDLLEALIGARKHLALFCAATDDASAAVFEVCDAAIAKARGETL